MASDVLSTIWSLAKSVKEAHDGVQGNKAQCTLLNDQVQHVAKSLGQLPPVTLRKREVSDAIGTLRETLRSCADLIGGFKKQHWIRKTLTHASTTEKFEELFKELDQVLHVSGFALQVKINKSVRK